MSSIQTPPLSPHSPIQSPTRYLRKGRIHIQSARSSYEQLPLLDQEHGSSDHRTWYEPSEPRTQDTAEDSASATVAVIDYLDEIFAALLPDNVLQWKRNMIDGLRTAFTEKRTN